MREIDLDGRDVTAAETQRKLMAALGPLFLSAAEGMDFSDTGADPMSLLEGRVSVAGHRLIPRAHLQLDPAVVRLSVGGMRNVVELERVPLDDVPGLQDAANEVIGAVLTALGEQATHDAIAAAQSMKGKGGFVVEIDLVTARVRCLFAKPGEDLSKALDLGGVVNGPETAH